MKGGVNSIQTLGTVDGPGIRFVVFMQGCPLRCVYCHNPETWSFEGGDLYTPEELYDKIKRYKSYFGDTGGITVSGGEPLMQAKFLTELFKLCKADGIHTCIDTSGCIWNDEIEELLKVTDLCLLDFKMTDEDNYKDYIGCEMKPVLFFLDKLGEMNIPTWIRQVIVSYLNDTSGNIQMLTKILEGFSNIEKIELLPFRKLCSSKYENMGIKFKLRDFPETAQEQIEKLYKLL